jgi:hypothetical protein
MKKIIFASLVLMLAGTVTAANVSITVTPSPDHNGWARIDYTADANVRAFALDIVVTGATIVDVNHYFTGECTSSAKGFGIFLDPTNGIDINDAGVVQDWGSPVADACSPGAAGTGIGTNEVIIGMGALYEDGNEPPLSGKLCSIKISSTYHLPCAKMSITAEDTYRGGVVLEDTNSVTPDVSGATDVCIWSGCTVDGWFALRSRCDNTNSSFGNQDGLTDGSDLTALLYFWGNDMDDCNAAGGFKDLCWRCDNTNSSFGLPDGLIDGSDLTALLYFWGQYSCN